MKVIIELTNAEEISSVMDLLLHGVQPPAEQTSAPSEKPQKEKPKGEKPLRIMTKARAQLEAAGHDIEVMRGKGSGKEGMITQADVKAFLAQQPKPERRPNPADDVDKLSADDVTAPEGMDNTPVPSNNGKATYTIAEVRKALGAKVQAEGPEATTKFLKELVGVEKISDVPAERYGEIMGALT